MTLSPDPHMWSQVHEPMRTLGLRSCPHDWRVLLLLLRVLLGKFEISLGPTCTSAEKKVELEIFQVFFHF